MIGNLLGDSFIYNKDYHEVCSFLGISKYDREDYQLAEKISYLTDWGLIRARSKNIENALAQIRLLKRDLGLSFEGKTLVNSLYQELRLSNKLHHQETEEKVEKIIEKHDERIEKKELEQKEINSILKAKDALAEEKKKVEAKQQDALSAAKENMDVLNKIAATL